MNFKVEGSIFVTDKTEKWETHLKPHTFFSIGGKQNKTQILLIFLNVEINFLSIMKVTKSNMIVIKELRGAAHK